MRDDRPDVMQTDNVISISLKTWWILVATLLLLFFALSVVVYSDSFETLLLRETLAPELEREFGFTAAQVQSNPALRDSVFAITTVRPGGAFARADVRPGDQPWDYHGQNELRFYQSVRRAREHVVRLHVARLSPGSCVPRDVLIFLSLNQRTQPDLQ